MKARLYKSLGIVALLLAGASLTGCGRLGLDAGAIFAAHEVLKRELPGFSIDFTDSRIVAKETPYYMIRATVDLTRDDEPVLHRRFLVVLAINPENGIQFRWHHGTAVQPLYEPGIPSPVITALKRRNAWGTPIAWHRRPS